MTKEELVKVPYAKMKATLKDLGVEAVYEKGKSKDDMINEALFLLEKMREDTIVNEENKALGKVDEAKPQIKPEVKQIVLTDKEKAAIKEAARKPKLSKEELEKQLKITQANLNNSPSLTVKRILLDKQAKFRRDLEKYNK